MGRAARLQAQVHSAVQYHGPHQVGLPERSAGSQHHDAIPAPAGSVGSDMVRESGSEVLIFTTFHGQKIQMLLKYNCNRKPNLTKAC